MKLKIGITVILGFGVLLATCQVSNDSIKTNSPKNYLYAELVGKSAGVTLTYERILVEKNSIVVTGLVGFGFSTLFDSDNIFSVGSSVLFRKNKRLNPEIGLSTSLFVNYNSHLKNEHQREYAIVGAIYCHPPLTLFTSLNLGARYHFKSNWFLRITYSPSLYRRINYCTTPIITYKWGGISVGKRF